MVRQPPWRAICGRRVSAGTERFEITVFPAGEKKADRLSGNLSGSPDEIRFPNPESFLLALSCHVCIPDMHMEESEKNLQSTRQQIDADFHITRTTIQFERAGLPQDAGYYMPQPLQPSK
jgi:hypothetical protein